MTLKNTLIILVVGLFVVQKWDKIDAYFNSPEKSGQSITSRAIDLTNDPVIFFSKSWCGWCNKTRDLLDSNEVDYVEYDIEISQLGREWHKEVGGKGVPVLIINNKVKHGYNKKKILKLINEA